MILYTLQIFTNVSQSEIWVHLTIWRDLVKWRQKTPKYYGILGDFQQPKNC